MDTVNAIGAGQAAELAAAQAGTGGDGGAAQASGFADALKDAVGAANRAQVDAEETVKKFAAGDIDDVHQVMLAMNRADLSFRMMLEVRNKLTEAYQEVMRMQA